MVAPREMNHARMHDPQGSGSLLAFCEAVIFPSRPSDASRKKYRHVINHLANFLCREPSINDLSSRNLRGVVARLIELDRSRSTVKEVREILLAIARQAHQHELLADQPFVSWPELPPFKPAPDRQKKTPWLPCELNQLLGSARTMPGDVAGIPSRQWWPALLLTLLDTGSSASELLDTPKSAYSARRGELAIGLFKYRLHPLAIEAIAAILHHPYENLIPWKSAKSILYRRMKHLLFRAGLPHVADNLFERLRVTSRDSINVLSRVNLSLPFKPRAGKPHFSRANDLRRLENKTSNEKVKFAKGAKRQKTVADTQPDQLIRITIDTPRNLLRFTNESYIPQRLADAKEDVANHLRRIVNRFSLFLACDATFDHLEEDIVERFFAWLKQLGSLENITIVRERGRLLALWRHAWRKKHVAELPRDITKLTIPKRVPTAWSLDEMRAILKAAGEVEGDVCGIPANLFWPALILALYCTGLRIGALMKARTSDLDIESRWLKIPAEIQKQNADQVFRLPAETVDAIIATNLDGRERLFPWPYDPTGSKVLTRHYRKILQTAGLSDGRRDLFHKLRRTSATAVSNALGRQAAQEHLGHSSMSVTERYIDPTKIVIEQSASERIPRLFVPPVSRELPPLISGEITG